MKQEDGERATTGGFRTLRRLLPHIAITISGMHIVFFFIDRVNSAMGFINNGITKALLFALCVTSVVNACFLIGDEPSRAAVAPATSSPLWTGNPTGGIA